MARPIRPSYILVSKIVPAEADTLCWRFRFPKYSKHLRAYDQSEDNNSQ